MKKMLTLRAIQTLKGNEAATQEILKALRKTKGNMRQACSLLEIGKSSMYRLVEDLGCAGRVDELVRELGAKVQGKVLPPMASEPAAATSTSGKPRTRTRTRAA